MKFWAGCIGLLVLFLAAGQASALAAQTATITIRDSITFTKGDARITRPVRSDEVFSVVTVAGDQVTISDEDGYETTLDRSVLKITDSVPSSLSAPVTNAAPVEKTAAIINNAASTATLPLVTNNSNVF